MCAYIYIYVRVCARQCIKLKLRCVATGSIIYSASSVLRTHARTSVYNFFFLRFLFTRVRARVCVCVYARAHYTLYA